MKRRSFVKASLLTSALAPVFPTSALKSDEKQNPQSRERQFFELRAYTLRNGRQQKLVEDYFQNAAIGALNKLGSKSIGVFTEYLPQGYTKLFALIPYKSWDDFMTAPEKMAKDSTYMQAAAPYLNAQATEPAYERIESSFFRAFTYMPQIEVPEKKQRIFELRRYESHNEIAAKKKIEMFNEGGEIAIFKRVGLTPVFFGEALIGPMIPNLTYMLTFDDMAAHDKNWKIFGSDPEWKKISSMPEYANDKIVSSITRTFLIPTAFSQV
jgi:hypothetical protein